MDLQRDEAIHFSFSSVISSSLALACLLSWTALGFVCPVLYGQSDEFKGAITKKLNEQIVLTRMTADGNDVVKQGSVVTLHKDGLQMCSTEAKLPLTNSYKEGKLSAGKFGWAMAMGMAQPSLPTANVPLRTFVADEKFWVVAIGVERNELIFKIYSDVYQDVRYYTQLAFPFNKKSVPTVDEMLKTVAEVITPEPAASNEPVQATAQPVPAPAQAPPPAPMQAIAPPPPPPDAAAPPPPTVALGQNMDQVIAILGQPKTIAKAGTKVIFKYADMKVTFLSGKVSDVE
jgi:hypothetical protein